MPEQNFPLIAIVGGAKGNEDAKRAGEVLGLELAKAKFRILVYSSGPEYLEQAVVRGYVGSSLAQARSVVVRFPQSGEPIEFPEQKAHPTVFDPQPDARRDWEMSFYESLKEADGILLIGGGNSTLVAGLVALNTNLAVLAIAAFGGSAQTVWQALQTDLHLPSREERNLMGTSPWRDANASDLVGCLAAQLQRRKERESQARLEERRASVAVTQRAVVAGMLFLLSVFCVFAAWTFPIDAGVAAALLFFSPSLAGISGATIRLVFDLRQGSVPPSKESVFTTASLGLIAGGAAALLFIVAQVTTSPSAPASDQILDPVQARKLVAFGVIIGLIAGLTLDAVFRKLIAADVADVTSLKISQRS